MADLFSGQGKVYIADVTAGAPGAFRFVGNAPQFNVSVETDVLEHKESTTGQRLTDARIIREKTAAVVLEIDEFTKENIALAFLGAQSTVAADSVVDEAQPAGLIAGDFIRTLFPRISSVVVKDSAGTPATLVLDTDYEITSANHGRIKILNVAGYTQPFTVSYDYAQSFNIKMLSEGLQERWVMLDGLNTAANNAPVRVDLYRVLFDPAEVLNMISDEFATFVLNGNALHDETKSGDATLGTFGRVMI